MEDIKVEAVIFDIGGVILSNGDDHVKQIASELGISEELRSEIMNKVCNLFFTGKINENDFWKPFVEKSKKEVSVDELKGRFRDLSYVVLGSFTLVEKLKSKYKVAVLSDTSEEWFDFINKKFHLEAHFPYIITSYEIGVRKPDEKTYIHAAKVLNTSPQNCVFVDNLQRNLDGAKKVGMYTVFCENEDIGRVEEDLRKLNVKI